MNLAIFKSIKIGKNNFLKAGDFRQLTQLKNNYIIIQSSTSFAVHNPILFAQQHDFHHRLCIVMWQLSQQKGAHLISTCKLIMPKKRGLVLLMKLSSYNLHKI